MQPVQKRSIPAEQRIGGAKEVSVSDLREGKLFEVCGVRYRKIHSNACRAYVRRESRTHVVIRRDEETVEFDSCKKGFSNISPNTMVLPIDEAEDLI